MIHILSCSIVDFCFKGHFQNIALTRCRAIAGRTARCRSAAVHFDTNRILQRHVGIARFLCHSTALLYSSTSATVQVLKLHTIRWFSWPRRETRR